MRRPARLHLETLQGWLVDHPNTPYSIGALSSHFGFSADTIRKKCHKLVEDPASPVALLVYQEAREDRRGRVSIQFCGGYCAVDCRKTDDAFHRRMQETIEWAAQIGSSVRKMTVLSYVKKPNVELIKQHKEWTRKIVHVPRALPEQPPEKEYESVFQFG